MHYKYESGGASMYSLYLQGKIQSVKVANSSVSLNADIFTQAESDIKAMAQYGLFMGLALSKIVTLKPTSSNVEQNPYADCYVMMFQWSETEKFSQFKANNALYFKNNSSFNIAFRIDEEGHLIEVITDLSHLFFRAHLYMMPRLNQLLEKVLLGTEYYLQAEEIIFTDELKDYFQELKSKYSSIDIQKASSFFAEFHNHVPVALQALSEMTPAAVSETFSGKKSASKNKKRSQQRINDANQKMKNYIINEGEIVSVEMAAIFADIFCLTVSTPPQEYKRVKEYKKVKAQQQFLNKMTTQTEWLDPMTEQGMATIEAELLKQLTSIGLLVPENTGRKMVLSIGSGTCGYEALLKEHMGEEWVLFCLEPESYTLDPRWKPEYLLTMLFESLPEEYKFDVIFMLNFNVVTNHRNFFEKIYRHLQPQGLFFLGRNIGDTGCPFSQFSIETHLAQAFSIEEKEVQHPGWNGSEPDTTYQQIFYAITKSSAIESSASGSNSHSTRLEDIFNQRNMIKVKEFQAIELTKNKESLECLKQQCAQQHNSVSLPSVSGPSM